MADLDAIAPNYRRTRQRWSDAPMLRSCHESLCACFAGSAHGQVDQVKAFIDSVCVTVVTELRGAMPQSSTPATTELLGAALRSLGLRQSRHATALDSLLSGFNRAGAATLGLILSAYEGKQPDLVSTREPYESFPHLNERIDRAVALTARIDDGEARPALVLTLTAGGADEAFELRVQPSELLYGIDREAYVAVLRSGDVGAPSDEEPRAEDEEPIKLPQGDMLDETGPTTTLVPGYQGMLAPLRGGVERFLSASALDPSNVATDGAQLLDSLLATAEASMGLDWKARSLLQARVKVACRRVLVRFGIPTDQAERVAGQFVAWLRVQSSHGESAPAHVTEERVTT